MMHQASARRFKRGDRVRCLRDPSRGEGVVEHVGVETTLIYLGRNEWLTEYVPFATVAFNAIRLDVRLDDIVKSQQVELYESLQPGDLVIYGKRKQARGIVIQVKKRRGRRPYVTDHSVIVVEGGSKKSLPLRHDILIIRRVTE